MNKILYTFLSILFTSVLGYAQPANDACGGATTLPQDGSCLAGTTVGGNDNWVGTVGCQANNNVNEVWYTFVSTGTQANITVTAGTMTGNIELILVEATGVCSGLGIRGNNCSASPQSSLFVGLTAGTRYYVTINSTGADGTFTICNTITSPPPAPGQDCTNAAPLCNENSFSQGVFTGVGVAENIATNSCFGGNERQSKWYTFTAGSSGTIEFFINPATYNPATQTGDDFDFALWNTTTSCYTSGTTMGAPIACNWSGCTGSTGVSPTFMGQVAVTDYQANNPAGPGDCLSNQQWQTSVVNLVAGQTYSLLIDNFTGSSGGFSFNFGGTATIGPDATFNATLDASCMTASFSRFSFYTGPNMTYLWTFGDGTSSTAGLPGPHTYATTGLYTVTLQVTDANGCVSTFSQTIDVGCVLLSVKLEKFEGQFVQGKFNRLTWQTAQETENDFFALERSNDGFNWEEVNTINGNGNVQETRYYLYDDYNFNAGSTNYYRLRQVQFNGTTGHSQIISIDNKKITREGKEIYKIITPLGQATTIDAPGIKIVIYTDGSSTMMINVVER